MVSAPNLVDTPDGISAFFWISPCKDYLSTCGGERNRGLETQATSARHDRKPCRLAPSGPGH